MNLLPMECCVVFIIIGKTNCFSNLPLDMDDLINPLATHWNRFTYFDSSFALLKILCDTILWLLIIY